jgi:O-antigen/teichoic acid export membrane protein
LRKFKEIISHELFKDSVIYTIAEVMRTGIPFFLLPVLTRYLSVGDYGIISLMQVIIMVVTIFVGLNTSSCIAVNFFKYDNSSFNLLVKNIYTICSSSLMLILIIVVLFDPIISSLIKIPSGWLWSLVLIGYSTSFARPLLSIWRAQRRPLPYVSYQVGVTLLNLTLSLVFVVGFHMNWEGRILGILISNMFFLIVMVYLSTSSGYLKFRFDLPYIKDALNYGIPLMPHMLAGAIMTGIDRIFISRMIGIDSTGIYTVGFQVGMIIELLSGSFSQAWGPFFFGKLNEIQAVTKEKIVLFTYLYDFVILILALCLGLAADKFLKVFVGPDFQLAGQYVFYIALGFAFKGMYLMRVQYLYYEKKTQFIALGTIFAVAINIVLNYVLIKNFGSIGAAQATAISFFCWFIITWFLAARVFPMPTAGRTMHGWSF